MATTKSDNNRKSLGRVKEPGYGRLPNGEPDLRPTAGYAGNEPVQYSDESDAQFQGRVSDFELRRQHAEDIENGGKPSVESQKKALKLKYDADVAAVDTAEATKRKRANAAGQVVDKEGKVVVATAKHSRTAAKKKTAPAKDQSSK